MRRDYLIILNKCMQPAASVENIVLTQSVVTQQAVTENNNIAHPYMRLSISKCLFSCNLFKFY